MRELIAMIFAVAGAALASYFLAQPISQWVAVQIPVLSPDENDSWETLIVIMVGVGGLILGWFIGWVIAGPLAQGERPPR